MICLPNSNIVRYILKVYLRRKMNICILCTDENMTRKGYLTPFFYIFLQNLYIELIPTLEAINFSTYSFCGKRNLELFDMLFIDLSSPWNFLPAIDFYSPKSRPWISSTEESIITYVCTYKQPVGGGGDRIRSQK